MAKVRLNKSALSQQTKQLQLYERLLPSLDLKRRQLTIEVEKARKVVTDARRDIAALTDRIGRELPMLANPKMSLDGFVEVESIEVGEENYVGVRVPKLVGIEFRIAEYSLITKPAWTEIMVRRIKEAIELRAHAEIAERRVAVLEHAMRRTTQRVNLFERVLIPTAKRTIQRIRIVLGDLERDAVVRSKLAKAKQQRMRLSGSP